MGNEARKTHCSHKVVTMQTMGNEERLTQGVTLQKMGNEARKTHCSHKELQCKQWVMKERKIIDHTRSYNANNG
ncbi:hypothetical protein KSS87_018083 [Heliosperma pusillum]|nr:hypothetical protein KSS87_018083 [Heliosperma pusillum]